LLWLLRLLELRLLVLRLLELRLLWLLLPRSGITGLLRVLVLRLLRLLPLSGIAGLLRLLPRSGIACLLRLLRLLLPRSGIACLLSGLRIQSHAATGTEHCVVTQFFPAIFTIHDFLQSYLSSLSTGTHHSISCPPGPIIQYPVSILPTGTHHSISCQYPVNIIIFTYFGYRRIVRERGQGEESRQCKFVRSVTGSPRFLHAF